MTNGLDKVDYQTKTSLFSLIPDMYAREEVPTQDQIDHWFSQTQSLLSFVYPSYVNNAFLHLGFFNIKIPFWWLSTWQNHMITCFNHLSTIDIINGLYACSLLAIEPKYVQKFLEQCSFYFDEKGNHTLSKRYIIECQRLFKAAQYFEDKGIVLLSDQNRNSFPFMNDLCGKNRDFYKQINEDLRSIFCYPRGHPLLIKCNENINERYKNKIKCIEQEGSLIDYSSDSKCIFMKSAFNRHEVSINPKKWNDNIADFIDLSLSPLLTLKEQEMWDSWYYADREKFDDFQEILDEKTTFIYFVRNENYCRGELKRDLAFRIEDIKNYRKLILFNLDIYETSGISYIYQLLSFMMPAKQMEERVLEYVSLMIEEELPDDDCHKNSLLTEQLYTINGNLWNKNNVFQLSKEN